jgi:hypothetical protein
MHAILARILNLVSIAVLLYLWLSLRRMETIGCECAMGYKRSFVMSYLMVRIIVLITCTLFHRLCACAPSGAAMTIVLLPLDLIFVVITLQYVLELKTQKCSCAPKLTLDILHVYAIILSAIVTLVFLALANLVYSLARTYGRCEKPSVASNSKSGRRG